MGQTQALGAGEEEKVEFGKEKLLLIRAWARQCDSDTRHTSITMGVAVSSVEHSEVKKWY